MRLRRPGLRGVLAALAALVVLAGLGAGAYAVGHSSGSDLDAARAAGVSAGTEAGKRRGERAGYAAGFRRGRADGFARAYDAAFRHAYSDAFRDLGVPPPLNVSVRDAKAAATRPVGD